MIVALHGFLGLPADWKSALAGREDIHTVDLWAHLRAIRAEGSAVIDMEFDAFAAWTSLFVREIETLIERTGTKPVLLGYSMGGRLALHALVARPELFESAVIVSANPGLVHADEKAARLANDKAWAERFRHEEWREVLRKWNAQGVLAFPPSVAPHERVELVRDERDFDRESLAQAMEAWSLAINGT